MNDTLAIIVTYNRKLLLNECIEALIQQEYKCDILIVDNNSSDDTNELVKEFINKNILDIKIYYYNTNKNLGGAGGYNAGVKYGIDIGNKYLWLMDDDCIVKNDTLTQLKNAANKLNDNFAFLSSKAIWIDGSICKTNVQRLKVTKRVTDFSSEIVPVDYASFVSLYIKREDVLKLGLPIKEFCFWTDDLEYTRRFSLYKSKINSCKHSGFLVNNSIVLHKCRENFGIDISKDADDRINRYYYAYRNDVYTFKREGLAGIMFLIARYFYHLFKIIIRANNKLSKISIMTKGYVDGLMFNPTIEYCYES